MKVLFSHINSSMLFSQNYSDYRFLMPLTVSVANLGVAQGRRKTRSLSSYRSLRPIKCLLFFYAFWSLQFICLSKISRNGLWCGKIYVLFISNSFTETYGCVLNQVLEKTQNYPWLLYCLWKVRVTSIHFNFNVYFN